MKSLKTLVRVHQRALDEKRRALNQLQEQADQVTQARRALAAEGVREADAVRHSSDGGYGYGSYLAGARLRDEAMAQHLMALSERIDAARDEIADAFAEVKRLELIEAAQVERARKEAARREQQEMNELGLNMFRRGDADAG